MLKVTSNRGFASVAFFALTLTFSNLVQAAEVDVQQKYQDALQDYSHRSATDSAPIDAAIQKLAQIENKSTDKDLNYNILILESRALYWKGVHTKVRDQVMAIHLKGQQLGDAAVALNPDYAEGYYYAGINLGRWGEANGLLPSLSKLSTLKAYMADASSRTTRKDEAGDSVDGYGPSRVLGRIFFKLPGVFGGSHKKSIEYLKTAVENAKELALNVVYYAETLNNGNHDEKVEAKRILDELLANSPESYNKDRVPESIEEFKQARELRDQIQ